MGSRVRAAIGGVVLSLMAALMVQSTPGWAQEADPIGTVLAVDGIAQVQAQGATDWVQLRFRDKIFEGDTVQTKAASKVKVLLRDDSIMTMAEQSEMTFTEFLLTERQQRSVVKLLFGAVKVLTTRILGADSSVEVHTPNAVAGVRGTTFIVQYMRQTDTTEIFVLEGTVTARNLDPAIPEIESVPPSTQTTVIGGGEPSEPVTIDPAALEAIEQAVQLIEQVPEEVTPTDQQGTLRVPASAVVDVSEVTPVTDVPQDIEILIEAGVAEFLVMGDDSPQTGDSGPDTDDSIQEAIQESDLGLTIEIPR